MACLVDVHAPGRGHVTILDVDPAGGKAFAEDLFHCLGHRAARFARANGQHTAIAGQVIHSPADVQNIPFSRDIAPNGIHWVCGVQGGLHDLQNLPSPRLIHALAQEIRVEGEIAAHEMLTG